MDCSKTVAFISCVPNLFFHTFQEKEFLCNFEMFVQQNPGLSIHAQDPTLRKGVANIGLK
jgi:hypothetical protein